MEKYVIKSRDMFDNLHIKLQNLEEQKRKIEIEIAFIESNIKYITDVSVELRKLKELK